MNIRDEMTIDKNGLKLVTQKSMSLLKQKDIILPSTYRVLFSVLAKKNNVDIGAENIHTNEEINDEIYEHILSIDSSADRALTAIKNRDESELQKVLEDTRKLKKQIESLKQIAYEDGLTKALNRKWLEENYFSQESEIFKKDGVLVLIDLNDFKQINDNMGHAVGDKVLIHLVARLKKLDAHVIRYGGDEFLLLFDNHVPEEVKNVINVLREVYLKKKYQILEQKVKISFGYGIAKFQTNENFSDIIAIADQYLYQDKEKVKQRTA